MTSASVHIPRPRAKRAPITSWEAIKSGRRIRYDVKKQPLDCDPCDFNTPDHTYRVVPTVLTKQGVPDLDRIGGRGYNGNRTRCPHKTPGIVPVYAKDEEYKDADGRTRSMRVTYCTGCDVRLWDDRTS